MLKTLIVVCLLTASIYDSEVVSYTQNLHEKDETTANWTVMYYLCCDNHISYEADEMIDNLTKIGSSNDFNLIVLKDGDKIGDSRLYYIKENGLINLTRRYSWSTELNMGDTDTLKNFLSLMKDDYPAYHYALIILSDHGSGWQGVCCDQDSWNNFSMISIPRFADVLKEIPIFPNN